MVHIEHHLHIKFNITTWYSDTKSESEEVGALDRGQDITAGAAVESSSPNNGL